MFLPSKNNVIDLNDYVALIRAEIQKGELSEVLRAIYKFRKLLRIYREPSAKRLFSKLLDLSNSNNNIIKAELLAVNTPVQDDENGFREQQYWSSISSIIFNVDPVLSPEFCRRLIENCLTRPTNMAFALGHSDVIASLARHHPDLLDASLLEIIITATDDSRSIYALKIARWLPDWSQIRDAVLNAMASLTVPKRIEAMWLVNGRSNINEVISFIEAKETKCNLPEIKNITDIKVLTHIVVTADGKPASYAIKGSGDPSSPEAERKLQELIQRLIHKTG
jgi:hypothetical protein